MGRRGTPERDGHGSLAPTVPAHVVDGGPGSGGAAAQHQQVARLQRLAGNRATAGLLAMQRLPFAVAPPLTDRPTPKENAADKVKEAASVVAKAGWLNAAVKHLWGQKPRLPNDLRTAIWNDLLGLTGIDPDNKSEDKAVATAAGKVRGTIKGGLPNAMNNTIAASMQDIAGRAPELATEAAKRLASRPWVFGELVDTMWREWLECPAVDALKKEQVFISNDTLKPLRAGVETAVKTYSTGHFTGAALAALTGPARDAVRGKVEATPDRWLGPADMDALTDHAIAETKTPIKGRGDEAWKDMRAKMADLLIVAEFDVARANIPVTGNAKIGEDSWARARGMYANTVKKPIWRFYLDDIVPFSFLGRLVGKAGGIHRNLLAPLARVEASAKRLAGASPIPNLQDVGSFRFEPHRGDLTNAHVSMHATGRAVDFDSQHNPFVSGTGKQAVGALGGVDIGAKTATMSRTALLELANAIDALTAEKAALEEKLKGTLSEEDKAAAEKRLSDVNANLAGMPSSTKAKQLRDQVGKMYDDLVAASMTFLSEWSKLTKGTGKASDVDMAALKTKLDDVEAKLNADLEAIDAKLATLKPEAERLAAESKASADAALKEKASRAQQELNQAGAESASLKDRLARLAKVKAALADPGKKGGVLADLETTFRAGGLVTMPKWLVEAFIENGFTWGGGWHEPADAMHFSYPATIEGVDQGLQE